MHTYQEIASNYRLWCECIDPGQTMTEEEFNNTSMNDRLHLLEECFGPEGEWEKYNQE